MDKLLHCLSVDSKTRIITLQACSGLDVSMDRLLHCLSVDGKTRIITLQVCSGSDVSEVLCISKVIL